MGWAGDKNAYLALLDLLGRRLLERLHERVQGSAGHGEGLDGADLDEDLVPQHLNVLQVREGLLEERHEPLHLDLNTYIPTGNGHRT